MASMNIWQPVLTDCKVISFIFVLQINFKKTKFIFLIYGFVYAIFCVRVLKAQIVQYSPWKIHVDWRYDLFSDSTHFCAIKQWNKIQLIVKVEDKTDNSQSSKVELNPLLTPPLHAFRCTPPFHSAYILIPTHKLWFSFKFELKYSLLLKILH